MKGLSVDFAFALLILVDLALAAQLFHGMHPDALLRGMNVRSGDSRRTVQRQQTGRFPLYMMQLYRTMLTEERVKTPSASVSQRNEVNTDLHESDSVVSLVAKSKYKYKV